ncbi:MAG: hypothetical protein ABFR90_09890, partial [Planctomycetota bacterium]
MLMLDNSGSMLDMAYIDKDTDGTGNNDREMQCFDDGFLVDADTGVADTSIEYSGNFDIIYDETVTPEILQERAWYKWVKGVESWLQTTPTTYSNGDLVYENGVVYKAFDATGNPSSGNHIYQDEAVYWEPLLRPSWRNSTTYHAKTFIFDHSDGRLYYSANGGTSNGTRPSDDIGVTDWVQVQTYANNFPYTAGDYVLWEDIVYQADNTATSSGDEPTTDVNIVWRTVDILGWQTGITYAADDIVTFDSMIFKAAIGHTSTGTTIYDTDFATNWVRIDEGYYEKITPVAASDFCSDATKAGALYTGSDICLKKTSTTPERVTAFAASGNLMNWLMASKFDVQKQILTGGKFNPYVDRVISESRGCAGNRFVKQLTLTSGEYLTMTVRGDRNSGDPIKRDMVDVADDVARIEILGINTIGYNSKACQDAVECYEGGGQGCQADVEACLSGSGTVADARKALNHAMQYCWFEKTRNLQTIVLDCEGVYAALPPGGISSYDNAYNCYGIYNENLVHDVDRVGYAGRCWQPGVSATGATCDLVLTDATDPKRCDWAAGGDPCEYWLDGVAGGTLLRQGSGKTNVEICTQLNNTKDACQNSAKWKDYFVDSQDGNYCDPTDPKYDGSIGGTPADWSSELDGDPTTINDDYGTPPIGNNTGLTSQAFWCVYQAMEDYCADLEVSEVIDPSNETTTSGTYGNIPAMLIDSGVMNQLGVNVPMLVMKGYQLVTVQPTGVLDSTAGQLRIGAMAFNSVGAYTECKPGAVVGSKVKKHCPADNMDGAELISPIKLGDDVVDATNDRTHVDDLKDAINGVRAIAWTPMAEAMFNAIGYFTQNDAMRLNASDFPVGIDLNGVNHDPVTNWCQENHVLIITEGASTADISTDVTNFLNGTTLNLNGATMVDDPGDNDASAGGECKDAVGNTYLQGSTYLDDLTYHGQNAPAVA